MSRFTNKTVVVTGASRGLGAAIAKRFASEGANVVLSANEQAVHSVAQEITSAGGKATGVICDVTEKQSVIALYDAAEAAFGRVDISVHNAASSPSLASRTCPKAIGTRSWP